MKKPDNYLVNVKDTNKNSSKDIFVNSNSFENLIKNETISYLEVSLFKFYIRKVPKNFDIWKIDNKSCWNSLLMKEIRFVDFLIKQSNFKFVVILNTLSVNF